MWLCDAQQYEEVLISNEQTACLASRLLQARFLLMRSRNDELIARVPHAQRLSAVAFVGSV